MLSSRSAEREKDFINVLYRKNPRESVVCWKISLITFPCFSVFWAFPSLCYLCSFTVYALKNDFYRVLFIGFVRSIKLFPIFFLSYSVCSIRYVLFGLSIIVYLSSYRLTLLNNSNHQQICLSIYIPISLSLCEHAPSHTFFFTYFSSYCLSICFSPHSRIKLNPSLSINSPPPPSLPTCLPAFLPTMRLLSCVVSHFIIINLKHMHMNATLRDGTHMLAACKSCQTNCICNERLQHEMDFVLLC